jgi:hypothetical protein
LPLVWPFDDRFGVDSTVQVFPFQFSASVLDRDDVRIKGMYCPTAVHAFTEIHDTPRNSLSTVHPDFGVLVQIPFG